MHTSLEKCEERKTQILGKMRKKGYLKKESKTHVE